MSKQKFNPLALDSILNDCMEDTEQLKNEITCAPAYADDDIVPAPDVSPALNNLVKNDGTSVDWNRVYSQLERLIENGNIALQVIAAIDPDVSGAEVAGSTATLMNAIKGCGAEFTKIHMMHLKFQQSMQLMELKHQYKMKEMEMRKSLYSKDSNNSVQTINSEKVTEMVEWETDGVMDYINFLNNKNN